MKAPPTLPLPQNFLNERITIALVGAGGNGSQMLAGLARLNAALLALGHPHGLSVTLFDPDLVTDANVGRQMFSPSDVGHSKAVVLINRVNMFYGLNWQAAPLRFKDCRVDMKLIIGCVDSAASRREIFSSMKQNWSGWWLDLGNSEKTGQVILGKHKRITEPDRNAKSKALEMERRPPTVVELFPEMLDKSRPEDLSPSCSLAQSLERQDLFINQTVATFALHLLWTWLRKGSLDFHGYFINLEIGHVQPMPIDPEAWQRIRDARRPVKKTRNALRKPKQKAKAKRTVIAPPTVFASRIAGRSAGLLNPTDKQLRKALEAMANNSRRPVKKKTTRRK